MTPVREITSLDQWEQALRASASKPLLVFKHSTACPVSAAALEEFEAYVQAMSESAIDAEALIVRVIQSRPVSNRIAEDLSIRHESPQLFYVKNGSAAWHASHSSITCERIEEALS